MGLQGRAGCGGGPGKRGALPRSHARHRSTPPAPLRSPAGPSAACRGSPAARPAGCPPAAHTKGKTQEESHVAAMMGPRNRRSNPITRRSQITSSTHRGCSTPTPQRPQPRPSSVAAAPTSTQNTHTHSHPLRQRGVVVYQLLAVLLQQVARGPCLPNFLQSGREKAGLVADRADRAAAARRGGVEMVPTGQC